MPNKFWLLNEGPLVLSSFLPPFRTQVSNLGFLDPPCQLLPIHQGHAMLTRASRGQKSPRNEEPEAENNCPGVLYNPEGLVLFPYYRWDAREVPSLALGHTAGTQHNPRVWIWSQSLNCSVCTFATEHRMAPPNYRADTTCLGPHLRLSGHLPP